METKKKINIYNLILFFMIGCFIGCIYEEILTIFRNNTLESRRGILFGPFNPVYGMGLIAIILVLYKIDNPLNKFIIASFTGGLFEYIIWFLQKLLFAHESWNYTSNIIINGQIKFEFLFWGGTSFFHAISWGFASFIFIQFFYPKIEKFINKIERNKKEKIAKISLAFITISLLITALAMFRYNQRLYYENNNIEYKKLIIDKLFNDEYIKYIFPNMTPTN